MLVPGAGPRSIDPRNMRNRGDQRGIRAAGRTPGRPQSATKLSAHPCGDDISVGAEERLALLQPCENSPWRTPIGRLAGANGPG